MELTKSFGNVPLFKGANSSFAAIRPTIAWGASQIVAVLFWEPAEIFHGIIVVQLSRTYGVTPLY